MKTKQKFVKESEKICSDLEHRQKIKNNISKYYNSLNKGFGQYKEIDKAKEICSNTKNYSVNNLEELLLQFEKNCTEKGIKILWAENTEQAQNYILEIAKNKNAKKIVKSKSMTTEEIHLNKFLQQNNIESIETDLGEFIVQVAGEKPYHIVTPAMHKSKQDVNELFAEKFNLDKHSTTSEMTQMVREKLRENFLTADIGITGANFLLAEEGAICLTENEGNAVMSFSFPKTHIAIAGIEKIIPSAKYLDYFWSLLSTMGTGQKITSYNSIVSFNPLLSKEGEGMVIENLQDLSGLNATTPNPSLERRGDSDNKEMYIILLDNGRTKLLAEENSKEALKCIRCGACLNFCPVYKNIGGYTYNTTYSGPIGAVISPHYLGFKEYGHLSFASSLCAKCNEMCPVKIPLSELLLENRKKYTEKNYNNFTWNIGIYLSRIFLTNRKLLNLANLLGRNKNFNFTKLYGKNRNLPRIKKSFNQSFK